jgi:hypothetical protein
MRPDVLATLEEGQDKVVLGREVPIGRGLGDPTRVWFELVIP